MNSNQNNYYDEHNIEINPHIFDIDLLAADIRRKGDRYSLIENTYEGIVDINQPLNKPFRWTQEDIGKEMVIVDQLGLFGGHQRVIELTLTNLNERTAEFTIDQVTMININFDTDQFEIFGQETLQPECILRINSDEIVSSDQLNQMSDFVYGPYGAPDYKDFSLFALIQYWAHHCYIVQQYYSDTV